jgi:hypothetical protein
MLGRQGAWRRQTPDAQYAITHTRTLEYIIVTKGTARSSPIPPTSEPPLQSFDADRPRR